MTTTLIMSLTVIADTALAAVLLILSRNHCVTAIASCATDGTFLATNTTMDMNAR